MFLSLKKFLPVDRTDKRPVKERGRGGGAVLRFGSVLSVLVLKLGKDWKLNTRGRAGGGGGGGGEFFL